jgi:Flp pilus assembly protein TadG
VVFISIIAFVINVGLFVKAKINLQNATDASAWAGAAVQSRQLSKIAYLNWEMRNIYKEWMYKYYVVGSMNTPGVEDPNVKTSCEGGKQCTNFRLAPD